MIRQATAAAVLVAIVLPAAALGARQPTRSGRAGITRAMSWPGLRPACFPLNIRVSTRNPHYAVASHRSPDVCNVGNGVSVLRRTASHRWRTVLEGSAIDCDGDGKVPRAVVKELLGRTCAG